MTAPGATYCPQCGAVYDDNRKTCPKCSIKTQARGVGWEPGVWICSRCGAPNSNTTAHCRGCGMTSSSGQTFNAGETPMPNIRTIPAWRCRTCDTLNSAVVSTCRECRNPRGAAPADETIPAEVSQGAGAYGDWICPKCGARGVGTANACTKCGASLGIGAASSATRSLHGLLFEPRPSPAPTWRPPMGSVPDKVDLRQYYTPVEDQLTTSSCAANAVVGALEYHQVRMGGKVKDLSRMFIYWNARRMADREGDDCGCTMPLVMAATLGYGACREELWPFDKSQLTVRPTQECYNDAGEYEAISFARITPGDNVRAAVAAGLPVIFGAWFPGSMYDAAASTGVMPGPAEQKEQPGSGHCMVIVGYDHPAQQWIVRNSWGAQWGDKGYLRIPYASMNAYSPVDCFWVIGAIEQTQGALAGPSMKDTLKGIQKSAKQVMNEAIGRRDAQLRAEQALGLRTLVGNAPEAYGNYIYQCNDCGKSTRFSENNVERCPYCGGRLNYIGPGSAAGDGAGRANASSGGHSVPAAARGYQGAPMPTSARRLDGCLFETRRSNAPVLNTPMGNAPSAIDLRQYCSPVEDQGNTNSCTANATVGALEYHQRRSGGAFTDISRLFVYWNSRQLAGAQADDCGSFIHHSMAAVLAHGACEENVWPFDLAQVLAAPPQAAYQNGANHEAVQYARTMLGNPVVQALAAGLPVVFGTYLPGRFYDEAARSGLMPMPSEKLDPPGSGHAMLIVGYDLPSKTWLVRNSWGERWADKGYFRVPFAAVEAYSYPDHFWAIGAIESKQGMSLSGPSPMQAAQATRAEAAEEMQGALKKLRGELRSDFQAELDKQKTDIRNRLRNPDKT